MRGRGVFHTTRWSLVQRAASGAPTEDARAALATLCETYWYPLYAWLRRRGSSADDALDQVQGFVARLLERQGVDAQPGRGKFRSYLLGALQHDLANERRAQRAQKRRGGGPGPLSIDAEAADVRFAQEPAAPASGGPDAIFAREWARDVLAGAFAELERELGERGHSDRFEALRGRLTGESGEDEGYASIAADLGLSVSAVKVSVFRMRERLRELIRGAVAHTVDSEAEIDDEVSALFEAVGPGRPGR